MKTMRRACGIIGVCILTTGNFVTRQAWAQDAAGQAATQNPTLGEAPIASVEAAPTLITLQMKNVAPQQIVDAFVAQAKAAGVEVKAPGDLEGGPTSITIDKQQFWAALRTLALRLDFSVSYYSYNRTPHEPLSLSLLANSKLRQVVRENYARRALLRGPISGNEHILIVADGATHFSTDSIKFGLKTQAEGQDTLRFQLVAYPAPASPIVPNSMVVQGEEAKDETGASILAPQVSNFGYSSSSLNPISLSIALSPNAGKRLARLKGTLRARLVTKTQTWTLPDIMNARNAVLTVIKPDSIERYIVEKVERPEPNQVLVRLRIERKRTPDAPPEPNDAAARLNRMRAEQNPSDDVFRALKIVDAEGRELGKSRSSSQNSGSISNADGQRVSAQLTFSRTLNGPRSLTGEAAKLVWEIPVEFREIEVPFAFSDLPLP